MRRSALVPRSVLALSFLGVIPACALLVGCPKKPQEGPGPQPTGMIVLAMQAFDAEPYDAAAQPQPTDAATNDAPPPRHDAAARPQPTFFVAMMAFDAALHAM